MIAPVKNKALFSSNAFSINLVTYPTHHSVMNHIDPVQQGRYYKLNFVLVKPKAGGVLNAQNALLIGLTACIYLDPTNTSIAYLKLSRESAYYLALRLIYNLLIVVGLSAA